MLTLIQWIQSKESLVRVLCDVLQVEELVDQRCVCWYYDCTLCSLHIHGTSCPHYIGKEVVPLLRLSLDDIIIHLRFILAQSACVFTKCFQEIIKIGHSKYQEHNLPLYRVLNW